MKFITLVIGSVFLLFAWGCGFLLDAKDGRADISEKTAGTETVSCKNEVKSMKDIYLAGGNIFFRVLSVCLFLLPYMPT